MDLKEAQEILNNAGYTTIAYNFDMLVKWTRKVKALG